MDNKNRIIDNNSIFGCTEMKRSPSELALEQLSASSEEGNKTHHKAYQIFQGSDSFHGFLAMENGEQFTFPLKNPEIRKGLSGSSSILPDCSIWSRNLYPNQSDFALPISSQSSICVDSPLSAHYSKGEDNQAVEDSSGSSQDQSDDNDLEIEAGPCEQSKSPTDLKRNKRMVSNRESARRSRRRKQAHLADLERQAEELRGENAALFKQLADTTQQFKDSTTNHRVLRSDVEALRAKVKLAEGMISGGSLTSSLSHLLHNYLNIPQDYINNNMNRVDHIVPPIVAARVDNNFPHNGILESTIGLENADAFNIDVPNGVECVPDLWNWDSHVAPLSK